MGNPIESLTDGQRACLRLAYQHLTSKEIARELGIAKATVDQRIDAARAKLGATTRKEAARILAVHEGLPAPDPILYDPIPVLALSEPGENSVADAARAVPGFPWPFPTAGRPDGLDLRWRLFWALVGVPVIVMVALGTLLSAIAALDTLRL